MKKILLVLLAIVLCLSFSMSAFAADYVPSIENKGAPEVIEKVDEDTGKKIVAEIVDDDKVEDKVSSGELIVTPYEDKDDNKSDVSDEKKEKIKENLEKTLEEIKEKEPAELNEKVEEIAKEVSKNADSTIYEATDVFDMSFSDDAKTAEYEQQLKEGKEIVITLDLDIEPDEAKPVIMVRDADTGAWDVIDPDDVTVNEDGTVTAKFKRLGTVAVFKLNLVKLKELDGTKKNSGDTANIGAWVAIVGVATVVIIALAVIKRKNTD